MDGRTRSAAVRAATACRVLRIGALEFKQMLSDRPDVLQALFWLQVERVRSLTHLVNRSHHRAITDQLTRLYNFGFFRERLDAELERARATSDAVSLAMFDIDHFKAYNDRNGHQEGNAALVVVSSLLRAEGRRGGVIARYGGEEFVALLYATDRDETISYAERVRVAVEAHVFPGGASQPGGRLTISAGVATFPEDAGDDEALIAAADRSLYDAKAGGRNRVVSVATRPVRCPVRPAFGSLCLARIPYGVRMEAQVSQPIEVPAFPGPAPSGSFYGEPPVAEPSVDFVNAS